MSLRNWRSILGAVLGFAAIAAFAAWFYFSRPEVPSGLLNHFRSLEQVEFCTIRPRANRSLKNPAEFGHGNIEEFAIVDVLATKSHHELVELLDRADRKNNNLAANCFDPRHALRDPNNPNNYLLICFKCYQMRYSFDGETGLALITDKPKRTFNAFITQHSLKTDEGLEPIPAAKTSEVLQPRQDD